MKEFTLVFTTRHRNNVAVEKDCMRICYCVTTYTKRFKYVYNEKELIVFHIFNTDKEVRHKILISIIESLHFEEDYQSLDLQSYTKN